MSNLKGDMRRVSATKITLNPEDILSFTMSGEGESRNETYESSEDEFEFEGRGRVLGGCDITDIQENPDQADHEDPEGEQFEGNAPGQLDSEEQDQRVHQQQHDLPPVSNFQPYKHPQPRHDRIPHLPANLSTHYDPVHNPNPKILRPLEYFMLFFDNDQFNELASNTNHYATAKGAGEDGRRRWYAVKGPELMIFIGIIIYMRLYRSSTVADYWRKDGLSPLHKYISPFIN